MQALDELVARWRKNPDPESTLALCAHLGSTPETDLIREVASAAETWHHDNHAVMLSVGRMHLDAGLLAEAQAALLQAGKLSPQDAAAYRFLGEVLLRRGDALRSERALARALELGAGDAEARLWHERAIVYGSLQKRQGMTAVADEVARTAPLPGPASSHPNPEQAAADRDSAGGSRAARRSRPPPAGRLRSSLPKPSRRRGSTPPPGEFGQKSAPHDTLLMGRSPLPAPARPPKMPREPQPRPPRSGNAPERMPGAAARANNSARAPGSTREPGPAPLANLLREAESLSRGRAGADTQPDNEGRAHDPFAGTFGDEHARPGAHAPARAMLATPVAAAVSPAPEPEPAATPSSGERPLSADLDDVAPSPESVLLALASVGLYEADGGVMPAWEAAPRPAPRRLWVLGGGLLAAAVIGLGSYRYALGVQRDRIAQAQELGMQLGSALESGSRARLDASENDFQRLFELDSRGRDPAFLWLENRALHALVGNEPVSGIESALQRARTVGLEESRIVFGRLASALATGDLPGAGATLAEWDARTGEDALYQLFSGAVLERAGNSGALERYTLATRLQPDLRIAHLFAARLALLTLEPASAKSTLEIACARLGPGPASDVLRGLEWASGAPSATPPPAQPPAEALRDLPAPLAAVAEAVAAVRAHREGRLGEARAAFERALAPASSPALAGWISRRALEAGELALAQKAAAQGADPAGPAARALAVRIELAAGRLGAARAAARSLDPGSRDALLVEAISAYEELEGAAAARLAASLPSEPGAPAEPLRQADAVITGNAKLSDDKLQQLGSSQRPWAGAIAIDAALDSGRLDLAERLLRAQGWAADAPAFAVRMARLQRYRGQGASVLELAPVLLARDNASPRSLTEAVLAFVAADRPSAALGALRDSSGAAGKLEPWLELIVEAARGHQPSAAKSAAALELPEKGQPALLQLVALRALNATKDRRARAYQTQLERRLRGQPELQLASPKPGP